MLAIPADHSMVQIDIADREIARILVISEIVIVIKNRNNVLRHEKIRERIEVL